jgi:hypothetical protein
MPNNFQTFLVCKVTPCSLRLCALMGLVACLTNAAPAQVTLYDNGPLSTGTTSKSGVAAPAGFTWSELQNDDGNFVETNIGIGYAQSIDATGASSPTGGFRLADDFTIPQGQTWSISSIYFYGYRSNAAASPSPFDRYHIQIWNGRPGDLGATVIFGDLATNRLINSASAAMYRIYNSAVPAPGIPTSTTRKLWRNEVSTLSNVTTGNPLVLSAGTYWIEFQASDTTNSTQHFCPAVTTVGARSQPGQNARQFQGPSPGQWVNVVDPGDPYEAPDVRQDVSFQVRGSMGGGGSPCDLPLPRCSADVAPPGGNAKVDIDDLFAVVATWGQNTQPNGPRPQGDAAPPPNGNCKVDIDDLFAVVAQWGKCN